MGFQEMRRESMTDWILPENSLPVLLAVIAGITTIGTV